MVRVRAIWQNAVEGPIRKVNEVVHGAQDAELLVAIPLNGPFFNDRRMGNGKEFVQRRFERFALTGRYVVSCVREVALEHFLAEFGEGGVVGRMG